jgi:hypothetical protein
MACLLASLAPDRLAGHPIQPYGGNSGDAVSFLKKSNTDSNWLEEHCAYLNLNLSILIGLCADRRLS